MVIAYVLTLGLGGCGASPTYRERAFDPVTHEVREYFDALTWLGSRSTPPRPDCFDELASDVEPLFEVHCTRADRSVDPPASHEPCPELRGWLMVIARLRTTNCVSLDSKLPIPVEYYEGCAAIALEAYRTYCGGSSEESCDELLDDAARAFALARLRTKALALWSRLRTPRWIEASRERREAMARRVREGRP